MNRTLTLCASLMLPFAAAAQTPPPAPAPAEAPRRIAPYKIILVGDSTTAVVGGWGPSFCALHVTSSSVVVRCSWSASTSTP